MVVGITGHVFHSAGSRIGACGVSVGIIEGVSDAETDVDVGTRVDGMMVGEAVSVNVGIDGVSVFTDGVILHDEITKHRITIKNKALFIR